MRFCPVKTVTPARERVSDADDELIVITSARALQARHRPISQRNCEIGGKY
jgi:hypothetical protein